MKAFNHTGRKALFETRDSQRSHEATPQTQSTQGLQHSLMIKSSIELSSQYIIQLYAFNSIERKSFKSFLLHQTQITNYNSVAVFFIKI